MRLAVASLLLSMTTAACVGTIDDGAPAQQSAAPAPTSKPTDAPKSSPITTTKLVLHAQPWKSDTTPLGKIGSVVEVGTAPASLVIFSDVGASLLTAGVVVAQDTSVHAWRDAAAIPAADKSGTWAVGVDGEGRMRRLRAERALEDVTDRYALKNRRITSVIAFGSRVAFGLEDGIATADGSSVTRWELALDGIAAHGTRVAGIAREGNAIRVLDVVEGKWRSIALPGVTSIAFDTAGRLVVTAVDALFVEGEGGALVKRYEAKDDVARGLVRSGDRLWLTIGRELALLTSDGLAITEGLDLPGDAKLVGTTKGDVFVLAGGSLLRWGTESTASPALAAWTKNVQPIFVKACSKCHLPGGSAKVDLSTFDAWVARKEALTRRVVVEKTMPPSSATFTELDRTAIATWLAALK